MSDLLDFLVDGVLVRETVLSQFKTDNALMRWRRRAKTIFFAIGAEDECDFLDALDDFLQDRRDEIAKESGR